MHTPHCSTEELVAGLDRVRRAPTSQGTVELIVARPAVDERAVLELGHLDPNDGLAGDTWRPRGSRHTPDGSPEMGRQLTIMGARAAALIAGDRASWPLAGDQLFVDLDLSHAALPAGTRVRIGAAEVEISEEPHNGCSKFAERFGVAAARFVNTEAGRALRLRGVNARIVTAGSVRVGDACVVVGAVGSAQA